MALVKCPDCGTDVSDAAAACVKCGRPMGAARPLAAPAERPPFGVPNGVWLLVVLAAFGFFAWRVSASWEETSQKTIAENNRKHAEHDRIKAEWPKSKPRTLADARTVIGEDALFCNRDEYTGEARCTWMFDGRMLVVVAEGQKTNSIINNVEWSP